MNPRTTESSGDRLPGCSIALKCANDLNITRCLDSIDDDVSINVVVTPNDEIEGILREREISYTTTEYGNIAKSTDIGVNEAEFDHVIVMDSDAWFMPGSIRKLRQSLQTRVFAKSRIEFETNGPISRVIAHHRDMFNGQPDYITNPGLAMRREEVRESCGGYIFNPMIRWTEDADLNYRARLAGLSIDYVTDAVVMHEPIGLIHELRAALLYGAGKRLSIEHTPGREPYEEFPDVAISALKGLLSGNLFRSVTRHGLEVTILDLVWQAIYLTGYHTQKRTQRWSLEEAVDE